MRDHDRWLDLLEDERKLRADGRIIDPWAHVVGDLTAGPAELPAQATPHFNPRPASVMRPGGASEAVTRYLRRRPNRTWVTHSQIVAGTGRTGKSVDWALLYLRGLGLIEHAAHPENESHRRYRSTVADRDAMVGDTHLIRTARVAKR